MIDGRIWNFPLADFIEQFQNELDFLCNFTAIKVTTFRSIEVGHVCDWQVSSSSAALLKSGQKDCIKKSTTEISNRTDAEFMKRIFNQQKYHTDSKITRTIKMKTGSKSFLWKQFFPLCSHSLWFSIFSVQYSCCGCVISTLLYESVQFSRFFISFCFNIWLRRRKPPSEIVWDHHFLLLFESVMWSFVYTSSWYPIWFVFSLFFLFQVSWVRRKGDELNLITFGRHTYSSDSRYSLEYVAPNNWQLLIQFANERDEGHYEWYIL